MDYLKKNKFLTAVVAILVLLNLGVVGFVFFFLRPPSFPPGLNARGDRMRFIEERLNFSEDQKAKFKELRQSEFTRMDSLVHRRVEAMRDLFTLLKAENPNPEQVQQKASAVGAVETEQSASMFKHFQALRALCTPDQQMEFDKIVTDAMIQARRARGGMGLRGPELRGPGSDGPGAPPGGAPLDERDEPGVPR